MTKPFAYLGPAVLRVDLERRLEDSRGFVARWRAWCSLRRWDLEASWFDVAADPLHARIRSASMRSIVGNWWEKTACHLAC